MLSRQKSKDVRHFLGHAIPYVITVCNNAREHCPIFPRTYKFLHWGLDDPAAAPGTREEKLAAVSQRCRASSGPSARKENPHPACPGLVPIHARPDIRVDNEGPFGRQGSSPHPVRRSGRTRR